MLFHDGINLVMLCGYSVIALKDGRGLASQSRSRSAVLKDDVYFIVALLPIEVAQIHCGG